MQRERMEYFIWGRELLLDENLFIRNTIDIIRFCACFMNGSKQKLWMNEGENKSIICMQRHKMKRTKKRKVLVKIYRCLWYEWNTNTDAVGKLKSWENSYDWIRNRDVRNQQLLRWSFRLSKSRKSKKKWFCFRFSRFDDCASDFTKLNEL